MARNFTRNLAKRDRSPHASKTVDVSLDLSTTNFGNGNGAYSNGAAAAPHATVEVSELRGVTDVVVVTKGSTNKPDPAVLDIGESRIFVGTTTGTFVLYETANNGGGVSGYVLAFGNGWVELGTIAGGTFSAGDTITAPGSGAQLASIDAGRPNNRRFRFRLFGTAASATGLTEIADSVALSGITVDVTATGY